MGERATAQLEIDYLRDELRKLRRQVKSGAFLREELAKKGFFTENLWSVNDVTTDYDCSDEQAQQVLEQALTNPYIMDEIWSAIHMAAEMLEIKPNTNQKQL
jgi:hypothetical protein